MKSLVLLVSAGVLACGGDAPMEVAEAEPALLDAAGSWDHASGGGSESFMLELVQDSATLTGCSVWSNNAGFVDTTSVTGSVTADSVFMTARWEGDPAGTLDDWILSFQATLAANLLSGTATFELDYGAALWRDEPLSFTRTSLTPGDCP